MRTTVNLDPHYKVKSQGEEMLIGELADTCRA